MIALGTVNPKLSAHSTRLMEKPTVTPGELTTNRKAFLINLDQSIYGTFAEIGAGQEVARHFFKVGGAAGTIAKSMSAYDMKFSDEIYGKSERYVSVDRLRQMLDHEYNLLTERLAEDRGESTNFFVFANTVAAASYRSKKECHGWMGLRFQLTPQSEPNDIIMHVRMLDNTNAAQQDALGIVGVNFVFGALMYNNDPDLFIQSLLDHLTNERIEVDILEFNGPDFKCVENRVLSLKLVEHGLTNAVMFGPDSTILQPSSALRKKAIIVERGSFRPITKVNIDMLSCAGAQFMQEEQVADREVVAVMEITMNNLLQSGNIDHEDFLARVDAISAVGYNVIVSNYMEYYRLSAYFRRYTDGMIGIVMGINHLNAIFNEEYYANLDGGILESFGRLFKQNVKVYVYPMKGKGYDSFVKLEKSNGEASFGSMPPKSAFSDEILITADNIKVKDHLKHLFVYLHKNHFIEAVVGANIGYLNIFSREIIKKIKEGDPEWEDGVPEAVVQLIKERKLWGYRPNANE